LGLIVLCLSFPQPQFLMLEIAHQIKFGKSFVFF
jgi:hypothetical protein